MIAIPGCVRQVCNECLHQSRSPNLSRTFVYPDRVSIETHGSENGHPSLSKNKLRQNLKAQGIVARKTNSQYGKIIVIRDEENISEWYCW